MGGEIDLLVRYPHTHRNVEVRGREKTAHDRNVARKFGKEFFDGDRCYGYGGFNYHPKYWSDVICDFQKYYGLEKRCKILDVGCAKGFMLYDFSRIISNAQLIGVDVSEYALTNAHDGVQGGLIRATAYRLPFTDNYFDLVVSINTIHNLEEEQCISALCEIERVGRGSCFITVDAYRTSEEKNRMFAWNLTAKTIKQVDEWKALFARVGYTGDYYWFTP